MTQAARSDHDLLTAHLAGDRLAFAELMQRHTGRLWAVAVQTLSNRSDAEDVVQEAFLRAHRAAATFRGDASVRTWLIRIVANTCIDRARRSRARPAIPMSAALDELPAPSDPIGDRDLRLDVAQALAALPMDQRLAVVLVDMQGYPTAEAATMLRVPVGTVKSRCARGRTRLAVLLGDLRIGATASAGEQR